MSIRHGLLALLERQSMHGYQLRAEFESTTGATWPLNVGQVYTTLTRLDRDGLVEPSEEDAEGRVRYAITASGRAELASWFDSPVTAQSRPRDELAIKLALAVTVPGVEVTGVIQRQRTATVSGLQELTRLKRESLKSVDDLSWSLVLESMRYQAEAEVRWLDHCETALAREVQRRTDNPGSSARSTTAEATRPTRKAGVRR